MSYLNVDSRAVTHQEKHKNVINDTFSDDYGPSITFLFWPRSALNDERGGFTEVWTKAGETIDGKFPGSGNLFNFSPDDSQAEHDSNGAEDDW